VGDCAFKIAELAAPAARFLKVRGLIETARGAVKIIQTLGNARNAADVVKIGGQGVLNVLKDVHTGQYTSILFNTQPWPSGMLFGEGNREKAQDSQISDSETKLNILLHQREIMETWVQ